MNVTRRTAIKAMAASLMVPCIRLRPEIDSEKLLAAFCDNQQCYRYSLEQPFGVGSLTYATDGKHMCRAELVNRHEEGNRPLPNIDEAWRNHWKPESCFRPFELPSIESGKLLVPKPTRLGWSPTGTCPLCDDRRISFGEFYPESFDDVPPGYDPDDNTYRDPSCPLCHGLDYSGPSRLYINGVLMSYSRLKPIAMLPNVRIAMSAVPHCLLFQADGFEGAAMGIEEHNA